MFPDITEFVALCSFLDSKKVKRQAYANDIPMRKSKVLWQFKDDRISQKLRWQKHEYEGAFW